MIQIVYVDYSTTVRFSSTHWGCSYDLTQKGDGDLRGFWYHRDPIPYRKMGRELGRIQNLGKYGDKRQRNNAVDHTDIDGSVTPAGTRMMNGNLTLEVEPHLFAVCDPGTYDITRWIYPSGNGAGRLVMYEVWPNGALCASVSYGFYNDTDQSSKSDTYRVRIDVIYDDHLSSKIRWKAYTTEWVTVPRYGKERMVSHLTSMVIQILSRYNPENAKTASSYTFNKSFTFIPFRIPERDLNIGVNRLMEWIPRAPENKDAELKLYKECLTGQTVFNSNGIAYAADLKKAGDSIRALLSLVADPANPKQWASAWLSLRFGDRLQVKDSIELISSIRGELGHLVNAIPYRETHARDAFEDSTVSPYWSNTRIYRRARLRCANESYNALMTSIKKLMDWDVWPTLENSWDMIPLSFVVDWFLNLSTVLSNIDAMVYEQYLRILFYERSDKILITFKPEVVASSFGLIEGYFNCSLTGKRYYRRSATPPKLTWAEGWEPGLPSTTNYVDGASLIVQTLT